MAKITLEDGTVVYGEIGDRGYIGQSAYVDYSKITQKDRDKLKHLIDIDYLEDAKEMIETILSRLKNNKEVAVCQK